MKIKYFGALFVYFVTFTLSVLIVGLPASTSDSCQLSSARVEKPASVASTETYTQRRIRRFLEADHQTGIELENDRARLSQSGTPLKAEKIATFKLVEKMNKVECGGEMPKDFCAAWEEHLIAWRKMAFIVECEYNLVKVNPNYRGLMHRNINQTYQEMLAAARRYGVDFKY